MNKVLSRCRLRGGGNSLMMTQIVFFLCAMFLCLLNLRAQTPTWTQFPNSPAGTTRHDDICFVDEQHGWSARGRGGIFKTSDGGNTWTQKLTNTTTHFRSIGFVSATRGFAGNLGPGSYDANVTDTNLLYRTDDGGETWSVVPELNQTDLEGFCALYVLDSQHIYGGGRVRGPAHFIKSEDGGNTWSVTNLTAAGIMGGIMDVYFRDPMNGFVVGMDTNAYNSCAVPYYHGSIARTTNGGMSWTVVANSEVNCSYFWKMSWPTPDVGYTSLQQNGSASSLIFFKTIDGGATWAPNIIPYSQIGISSFTLLQGIGFINANEGWVGGPSSTSIPIANTFLHTTNGGANWMSAGYNDSHSINRIRVYTNFAVASGAKLHIYRVPLTITVQPSSQTNAIGSTAAFSTTAYGTQPLTYQWRFNGSNIFEANTNFYSIASVQTTNAGNYDLIVSDSSGSVTSSIAMLVIEGGPIAPGIVTQPQSQTIIQSSNAIFTVVASGTAPLSYQWRFNSTNLFSAFATNYIRTNVQPFDAGNYSVIVSNSYGSVTSSVATLTVLTTNALFAADFDNYNSPQIVTNAGTTNGYKIFYRTAGGPIDFKAVFGFDYSTISYPTTIPSAPHSIGGTTKGLFLTVNKDAIPAVAAVNLYPTNQFFSGNFALKFDLWINWANLATSTEHALFGINHSGNVTNRITQPSSDGLFFAVEGEDASTASSTTIRDYSIFRGGGNGLPFLMFSPVTTFGPTPLLGPNFDNADPGFINLFPAKTISGYGTTPSGTAGLRWISGEVRQENNLITWLFNGVAVAQFTNTTIYTNGTILLGYNDHYSSIGDSNNFVIFDNVRVENIISSPILMVSPRLSANIFNFTFATDASATYSVQRSTNLSSANWILYTNIVGSGASKDVVIPISVLPNSQNYFRVTRP